MTSRDFDVPLSSNQRAFILKALQQGIRTDARKPLDQRKVKFFYALDDSSCTVLLGRTRVMSVVTAALEAPYPDRPNEGSLRFNVEFSPMASPSWEAGRPGEAAIELARLIERSLRDTQAVDQEALCVLAGRKVWALRVDTHVLDNCGNVTDAAALSALAALLAFRRPDVMVSPGEGGGGQRVVVHSADVKEPVPLSIHHLPLAVTFAFMGDEGDQVLVDPSLEEEAAARGFMTAVLNSFGELCALQKANGIGISSAEVMRLLGVADQTVKRLVAELQTSLKQHEVERVQARVRRHTQVMPPSAIQGERTAVLQSHELADPAQLAAAAAALAAVEVDSAMDSSSGEEASDEEMAEPVPAAAQEPAAVPAARIASAHQMAAGGVSAPASQQAAPPPPAKVPKGWRQSRPPSLAAVKPGDSANSVAQLAATIAGDSKAGAAEPTLQDAVKARKRKARHIKQEPE